MDDDPKTAEEFAVWLQAQLYQFDRDDRVRKTSKMMEHDCTAASLPYVGDLGVADFHSHRVAFITNLCRTADFSTVVDLARHSDPKLTAKVYDRVRLENRTAAINGLTSPAAMAVETRA